MKKPVQNKIFPIEKKIRFAANLKDSGEGITINNRNSCSYVVGRITYCYIKLSNNFYFMNFIIIFGYV